MKTTQPLTKDEHRLLAKQIYILCDALLEFERRYRRNNAVKQAARIVNELGEFQGMMDDLYCAQFPDNPRPADPDFMDSPYYSATIHKAAREKN